MIKRLAVLLPLFLLLVRCWTPFSSDPLCHSIHAVNSGGFVVDCPTAATQFCAVGPIVATSSTNARGACDACFGAGTCSLSFAGCGTEQEPASWEGTLNELPLPPSHTEFQFLPSRQVAAGEISTGRFSDPACVPRGRWAP